MDTRLGKAGTLIHPGSLSGTSVHTASKGELQVQGNSSATPRSATIRLQGVYCRASCTGADRAEDKAGAKTRFASALALEHI